MLPPIVIALFAFYLVVGYLVLFTLYEVGLIRPRATRRTARFVFAILLWPITVVYLLVDRVVGRRRAT